LKSSKVLVETVQAASVRPKPRLMRMPMTRKKTSIVSWRWAPAGGEDGHPPAEDGPAPVWWALAPPDDDAPVVAGEPGLVPLKVAGAVGGVDALGVRVAGHGVALGGSQRDG